MIRQLEWKTCTLLSRSPMTHPFDSSMGPSRTPQPRKSERIGLSAEVILRRTGHSSYRVKILDVSLHGCKAEFVERPKLDELVWVKFDDLQSLEALVCWSRGFEVGLEFERPFYPAVFEMLVSKLSS
jgi:PilZ domain